MSPESRTYHNLAICKNSEKGHSLSLVLLPSVCTCHHYTFDEEINKKGKHGRLTNIPVHGDVHQSPGSTVMSGTARHRDGQADTVVTRAWHSSEWRHRDSRKKWCSLQWMGTQNSSEWCLSTPLNLYACCYKSIQYDEWIRWKHVPCPAIPASRQQPSSRDSSKRHPDTNQGASLTLNCFKIPINQSFIFTLTGWETENLQNLLPQTIFLFQLSRAAHGQEV